MTLTLTRVRAHLRSHFARAGIDAEPGAASVTFLGTEPVEVLRFGPGPDGAVHYVSLGCSRRPMVDPADMVADPIRGPRAEVVLSLRNTGPTSGLARAMAVLAATPAVDGVVLTGDALIDLGSPLWAQRSGPAPFTAVLLGEADGEAGIAPLPMEPPCDPVEFLSAIPVTATEAAWIRLKGTEAMRQAWRQDGIDVLDPTRRAGSPAG